MDSLNDQAQKEQEPSLLKKLFGTKAAPKPEKANPNSAVKYGLCGLLFAILAILGVIFLAWGGDRFGEKSVLFAFPDYLFIALPLLIVAVFGLFWLVYKFNKGMDRVETMSDDVERNSIFYGRFISILGISIILLSIINAITLGGLIYNKVLTIPFSNMTGSGGSIGFIAGGNILTVSMLMAVLGSLFFTANTLISARNEGKSDFSRAKFWSGLWFRMGESVLFVLVFFVLICSRDEGQYKKFIGWMPALALFLGMFVKSGERVVFGIAERLFEMVKGLLPAAAPSPQAAAPGAPRNLSSKLINNDTLELSWDEPVVGGPVSSYKIYHRQEDGDTNLLGETPPGNRRFKCRYTPKDKAGFHVTALNNEVEGKPSNEISTVDEIQENRILKTCFYFPLSKRGQTYTLTKPAILSMVFDIFLVISALVVTRRLDWVTRDSIMPNHMPISFNLNPKNSDRNEV